MKYDFKKIEAKWPSFAPAFAAYSAEVASAMKAGKTKAGKKATEGQAEK